MNRDLMNIALRVKHEIDTACSEGAVLVTIYEALERAQIFAFAAGYDEAVDDAETAAAAPALTPALLTARDFSEGRDAERARGE